MLPSTLISISDLDVGQAHSCQLVGAGSTFEVGFSDCKLRLTNSLDYEAQSSHSFTLVVTDNGTPTASTPFLITVNVGDVNEPPQLLTSPGSVGALDAIHTNAKNPRTVINASLHNIL